ncbi:MAG TPA: S8 family serine peptidase, partial [Myxococcota bacterium]|nr:S8 family serine peptidase [Myxococcota bacterium]
MPSKAIAIPSAALVLLALVGPSCDGAGEPGPGVSTEELAVQKPSPRRAGTKAAWVVDEVLVTLRAGQEEGAAQAMAGALGHRVERRLRFESAPESTLNRTYLLRLTSGVDVEQAIAELTKQPGVEAAQPNYLYFPSEVPSDPYFNMAWAHRNLGGNAPFQGNAGLYNPDPRVADMDMDTPEANDEIARRGFTPSTIIVGVIDSGVDYTHPDLAAVMWPGLGYDFYSNDTNPMDEDSHGTHVAGAIAAIHNSIGVYGTTTNVQIMALRFIGPTGGSTANAIAAINYGVTNGAKVLNNSWGGGAYDASLAAAIAAARDQGVVFVVASGNDGTDNDTTPSYPGNYPYENVISVGASSAWGDGSLFSNYGLNTVHLYAPGEEIVSTTPNILTGYPESLYQICMWDTANSVWLSWSGTSMAAPHASGAAAIVYGLAPNLITGWAGMTQVQRVSAIRQRLMDRSQRWASLAGLSVTGGHLNVFNLVEEDATAPATPTLGVHLTQSRRVLLRTTATGDDGNAGQANYYDLRVAEGATFDYATAEPILGLWTPSPVGQVDNFTIGGLSPGTTYRFGLEVVDNAGNRSALSNVVVITTPAETVLLDDDVEGGLNGWTGDWGQVTAQSHSPTHSWTDSPGGNYPNNANLYLVSPEIVANDQLIRLSFWQRYDLQANADYGRIQIRTYDGATWSAWTSVDQVTGTNTTWHEWAGTILATGQRVQLRFWLSSNASTRRDGWYLDDILVTAAGDAPDTLVVDETFGNATNWTLTPTWAVQGGVLDDSPGANYRDNNRSSATFSAGVDLSDAVSASISFDLVSCAYEQNYDWLIWEYSLDNVQWRIITGFTGTASGAQEVNLTPLIGYDTVYFRFRSYTDYTVNQAGCRLDNLQIWIKEPATCTGDPDCDDGDACNGAETCVVATGSCLPGTPLVCDDGNLCTTDSCVPATGCSNVNNTVPCPDGNLCNGNEVCAAGSCQAGTPLVCNDGNVCTTDSCVPATGCSTANNTLPCPDGNLCNGNEVCSAGSCQAGTPLVCNDGNVCTTDSCVPATGCSNVNNTVPCPDGNLCNGNEVCAAGSCQAGTPLVCDDGNLCTTDSCVPATGCSTANNTLPCPDGNLCNGNEVCSAGSCQAGTPLVCNDGNLCTTDSCVPATGCSTANNTLPCPDGNLCNGNEVCSAGSCQAGTPLVCNDGNVCTTDSCVPATGCSNVNNTVPCPDGNLCNGNEVCAAGSCQAGTPLVCDDGNLCTTDSCVPATGCSTANNTLPCPDGNLCNGNEVCSAGSCQAGTPLVCNDGNVCTTDSCVPATGCSNVNNTVPCPDGNLCNGNEVCSAGSCQAGTPLTCNDGNLCTTDSCVPATGCAYANNALPCPDGDLCNGNEACSAGSCQAGTPLTCNDGNLCTTDSCVPATGCSNVNNTVPCPDGNLCNGNEVCAAGSCQAGTPLVCNDGNLCTTDSCVPATGCSNANNTLPCPDGDLCNGNEACSAGSCQAGTPLVCNDGNVCTTDSCVPATGCSYANNTLPCPDGDLCDGAEACSGGSCQAGTPLVCNDGNVCTMDSCVPATGCAYPANTGPCDDADDCTMADACAAGTCQGDPLDADGDTYVPLACLGTDCDDTDPAVNPGAFEGGLGDPTCADGLDNDCDGNTDLEQPSCSVCSGNGDCSDGNACNGDEICAAGSCEAGTPLTCDDGNLCTTDSCNPATGCAYANNTLPCPDGNLCNGSEVCAAGACQAGTPLTCNDGNVCTTDSCVPATGCSFAPNTASCADGDLCDGAEVCSGGTCQAGTPLTCNDGNVCTTDSCVPATGCSFVPNTASCADADLCDGDEVCSGGTCQSGTPLVCNDGNVCTTDSCVPATGC